MGDDAPIIEYRGVRKRFGGRVVLDGVDLDVGRGEIVCLLGPSGTGKTVLLKLLVGLLRPDAGSVRFEGTEVSRLGERQLRRLRQRLGYVFQSSALFDSLSVEDNVAWPLRVAGRGGRATVAARARECLALVGMPDAGPLAPAQLSGGMRKRVAVARALASAPEALLYDEPTVGLDPANVRRIAELIALLRSRLRNTALVVTHDRSLALGVADRVALLLDGRLAWIGTADEARERPPAVLSRFLEGDRAEEAAP